MQEKAESWQQVSNLVEELCCSARDDFNTEGIAQVTKDLLLVDCGLLAVEVSEITTHSTSQVLVQVSELNV